jgi:hypothetical protein
VQVIIFIEADLIGGVEKTFWPMVAVLFRFIKKNNICVVKLLIFLAILQSKPMSTI